jgi:2-oxoisovalerate dehydrogenase E1 component
LSENSQHEKHMTRIDQTEIKTIASSEANFARATLTQLIFIRAFEAKAWSFSQVNPARVMGSMHFCAGQEAVPVGAVAGLRDDDQLIATYRGHGWALASGLNPRSVMAEICHRAEGLNGGRGGSAYLMAPHTRFIGENSIVGAGTTMACGVAMANVAHKNGRVVVVTIGDGAMNQGAVHEAMAFGAARKLPVVFVVENNGWSELTATNDMFLVDRLAKRAAGYGISSATISGVDAIAVRDTIAMAAKQAREGGGPSLIECRVPRLWGHYNRDIEHYRSKADKQAAEALDPIALLSRQMIASGLMTADDIVHLQSAQTKVIESMTEEVMDSAMPDVAAALHHVVALPDASPLKILETKEMTYLEAVNLALRTELESDSNTVIFGEDVGKGGGIFGATRNLQKDFGAGRVFDTPIAENAILGSAVGAAIAGLKPIVEIMWADFLFVAIDQIINQAANIRYITGGRTSVPMVVRTQQGVTPGSCAQHSQSVEAILAHIPGIKVAIAATGADAYALLRAAAADPDPCIVIESRGTYQINSEVTITDGAEQVGIARLRRKGSDCAIITWGTMVQHCIIAAGHLAENGIEASVLDLRWLSPIDDNAIIAAVTAADGNVLIVHEAVKSGGFAGEIGMRVHELCAKLAVKVKRLTTPDVRMPASPTLQAALLPNANTIAEAVRNIVTK